MRTSTLRAAAMAAVVALVAPACSRATTSGDAATTAPVTAAPAATPAATDAAPSTPQVPAPSTSAADDTGAGATDPTVTDPAVGGGPGDFGTLTGLCGPGDATGATDQGVTDTEIRLGTMGDPGNTVVPGAGQENFDVANAFVSWCNAAGGINGRQLSVTTRDSKLFEVGARMIEACASDFMLVGNATPLDEAGVDTRLDCGLAQIPAYTVSAKAADAPLQVVVDNTIHQVVVGPWQALQAVYPDAFSAVSFVSVDGGGLDSFAKRQRDAIETMGATVVDFQLAPVTGVDNWRPYAQTAASNGAESVITLSPDIDAFVRSMGDVGWEPQLLPLGVQNYTEATINLAREGVLPPTYVSTSFVPFEAVDEVPAMQQAVELVRGGSDIEPNFAHLQALTSWLLWASAAKACGSDLTRHCVIEHAGAMEGWTAGGVRSPVDTQIGAGTLSHCFTLLQATPEGFVLVPEVTEPNDGVFNCDPGNVVDAPETYTAG